MNASVTPLPNSKAKLQERLQAGRITWAWPVITVFFIVISTGTSIAQTFTIEEIQAVGGTEHYSNSVLDQYGRLHVCFYEEGNLMYATRTGGSWTIETVDSSPNDVGKYCAVAVDHSGTLHIAYYDETSMDLKYAKKTGSSWAVSAIDTTGDVGMYTSITTEDSIGLPFIGYYDESNERLKLAYWEAGYWNVIPGPSVVLTSNTDIIIGPGYFNPIVAYYDGINQQVKISIYSINDSIDPFILDPNGWGTEIAASAGVGGHSVSIALKPSGEPIISYSIVSAGTGGSLWHVEKHCDAAGCFTQVTQTHPTGQGNWHLPELVSDIGFDPAYSSLEIDNSGNSHISYYNSVSTVQDLEYITRSAGTWSVPVKVDSAGNVGYDTSLSLDSDGNPHITYYDLTNQRLKYAYVEGVSSGERGIVFLFDNSGSMKRSPEGVSGVPDNEQRHRLVKNAVKPLLDLLLDYNDPDLDKVGLAAFPHSSYIGCNGQEIMSLQGVNSTVIAAAKQAVDDLDPYWNTPLLAGIDTSLGMFDTEIHKAIVLLSDGYHNCPSDVTDDAPEVVNLISRANSSNVNLFTIGFGKPGDTQNTLLNALATGTGGGFQDVTGDEIPQTDLQEAYKEFLAEALDLELLVDPRGVLNANDTHTHLFHITKFDKALSVYLSWVTPEQNRLDLKVFSSDGVEVLPNTPGIVVHNGPTYTILTAKEHFLRQAGKISEEPWKLQFSIPADSGSSQEPYQYSVLVDSDLRLHNVLSPKISKLGKEIRLTAYISVESQMLRGLTDIKVSVTEPSEWFGNVIAQNKVSAEELEKVIHKEKDPLSSMERRIRVLKDKYKVQMPHQVPGESLTMHDDGTNGDTQAKDGIYTAVYRPKKPGTHTFSITVNGKSPVGEFHRERQISTLVGILPDPEYSKIEFGSTDVNKLGLSTLHVSITPMDNKGNYMGPGFAHLIRGTTTMDNFDKFRDLGDGTYAAELKYDARLRGIIEVQIYVDETKLTASTEIGKPLLMNWLTWILIGLLCLLVFLIIFWKARGSKRPNNA